ncbi:MAG TPA: SRPBCC family protein [Steroidobacteraceae bacterium]|nr:SRPBCC family protein [Steroidobacteraceae bacterium]
MIFIVAATCGVAGAAHADLAADLGQHGDVDVTVTLDPSAQSGSANASVKIHADRAVVWSLLTSCADARKLVPGLVSCDVIETAPDHSWQLIRHVIAYSWYVPRVDFVFRADYRYPDRITLSRVSGDLRVFEGRWDLEQVGDFTTARYSLALAPGFWVPRWLIRAALRHDLPKVMRSLRALAEAQG